MSIRNRLELLEKKTRSHARKVKIFSWRDWEINKTEAEREKESENSIVIVNIPTETDCLEYGDIIEANARDAYQERTGKKWEDRHHG